MKRFPTPRQFFVSFWAVRGMNGMIKHAVHWSIRFTCFTFEKEKINLLSMVVGRFVSKKTEIAKSNALELWWIDDCLSSALLTLLTWFDRLNSENWRHYKMRRHGDDGSYTLLIYCVNVFFHVAYSTENFLLNFF